MEENDIDSPDVSKKTPNTATSDSSPVQESPFFTFANNLSPLESVKAPRVSGHHFLGLNSPPMVFTSPRIHIRRGSNFLDRPHFSPLATVQSVDEVKVLGDGPADSEMLASLLPIFITPNKNYPDTQHCNSSPSPCVESVSKYFADPSDIDQESLVQSVDPDVKPCNENAGSSLNDLSHSEKAVSEFDGKHGPDDQMNRPLILLEDFECSYREKVDEAGKVGGEKAFELTSQECPKLETVLFADHALQKQRSDDSTVPCTGNEMQDHCDLAYQSMLEPLLDVVECENDSEIGITSHVSLQNLSRESTKASQKHRGLPRRCLRFGEAASSAIGNLNSCPLQAHVPVDSIPSDSSVESKDLETSHVALNDASGEERMIRQSKPVTPTFSPQCNGSFKGSKPSGIGLHLNSIVNAMPHDGAAFTGMKLADTGTDSHGGKSVTIVSCRNAEDLKKGLISSNMDEKISVGNKCERHERNAPIPADSLPPGSPSSIEPTHLSIHVEHPAYVNDELKLISVGDGRFEGSNQTSPKKKKKKTSNSADDDGCKRCNCKKSRCLKLYCDCFAAGLYCTSESCSCQNCLNRPEYSEKVLETRQQIEIRNPHAFAPKIVQHVTDSSSNNMDDANVTTPSSARHKRGCNCKKSECLKKYCECYQANVGCSGGCRCEGCKNAYGKKEEFLAIEHALSEEKRNKAEEGSNSTLHEELETEARKKDLSHGELYDLLFLSPVTPSLEYSDKGKQAANLRVPGKYIPATEVRNASYEWQQASKEEMMDQSSTRCDSVAKVDHLAISNSQSMSNDSFSTKTKDQTHIMRILSGGSLRWRSSPITPMTKLGETKSLQCLESDSKLPDILEDETPEVLKEASTPTKSVKTSSPKQKRVSPPHSHLRGLGSSSSGGLRIGRKFILKAVPSFPPLTPCITSKANNDHETSENCKQVTDVPKAEKKTTQ